MSVAQVHIGRNFEEDKERIISLSSLPIHKIWNIYLYGSRIYGTHKSNSDLDVMMVASQMNRHKEIKDGTYNLHIMTPDAFIDDLNVYKMVQLECIFSPNFGRLQEKRDLRDNFVVDPAKVKKYLLSQSHDSWVRAKMKFRERDVVRGTKGVFHSLRMLIFGEQLVKNGEIFDFSAANGYWDDLDRSNCIEWSIIKEKFLHVKQDLERRLIGA